MTDDLGVNHVASFVDAEHGSFFTAPRPALPLTRRGPKVALIDLDGAAEGSFELACLGHPLSQAGQERLTVLLLRPVS